MVLGVQNFFPLSVWNLWHIKIISPVSIFFPFSYLLGNPGEHFTLSLVQMVDWFSQSTCIFRDEAIKRLKLKLNFSSQHPVDQQRDSGECRKKTRVKKSKLAQSLVRPLGRRCTEMYEAFNKVPSCCVPVSCTCADVTVSPPRSAEWHEGRYHCSVSKDIYGWPSVYEKGREWKAWLKKVTEVK